MNKQELDELYFAALRAGEAGDYEKAIEMFRRGAQLGDTSACNAVGIAYNLGSGVDQDKQRAIEWFKRAYDSGKNPCYCANIALTYAEIGQLKSADEWWNRAIESDRKSSSLGYAKFLLHYGRYQSWQQIMRLLEVAATATARIEVSEEEQEEAQELLDALGEKRTPDEIAEVWQAHEAFQIEDQIFERGGETAKNYFSNAAQVDPQNKSARFYLMLLALDKKDLHKALIYASEVKELSPREPDLNLTLGRIYELTGTYGKAIACHKKELAISPDRKLILFNLGAIFVKLRKWNKAIFYFARVLEFKDSEWEMYALGYLSIIYNEIHDIKNERRIYRRMIAQAPNSAAALQNLGATYIDTRDYARALEILRQAKILDDSDAMIARNIAKAERGLSKYSNSASPRPTRRAPLQSSR